ncbi:RiPP maturation radical SAM C-methyltransferase [Nocardioides aurantiacus]|nr:RiPP maturation radical SAM C-methyltransferase [Nocardioides aurantiacus]
MQIGRSATLDTERTQARHLDSLSVGLVCMPWAVVDMPSLALSTVGPVFADCPEVAELDVVYANIAWLDHLRREADLDPAYYELIVDAEIFGIGEWVFSSYFRPEVRADETRFHDLITSSKHVAAYEAMFAAAPDFIDQMARQIIASAPDVVGLTSTFDQNIASFALAHRIKALAPHIVTVLGGANCDGVQGTAVHQARRELDYVIRGEAERAIGPLVQHIAASLADDQEGPSARVNTIAGLCWRSSDGESVSNPPGPMPVSMNLVPEPDYRHYFRDLGRSSIDGTIDVKLPLEASRGCWWGAKHHCTFCGLNGSAMTHRAKPAERVQAEASRAVLEHNVLDLVFSDNILAPDHVTRLVTDLSLPEEWDVRLFAEVKSNLSFSQLEALAQGGFTQLQPGIESLSSSVLKIMRKGVTGWQNVRFLRDCATSRIYPSWNILTGFPAESDADYVSVIESLPSLHHLTAPAGVFPIKLERFSPYFDDPDLGLTMIGPADHLVRAYEGVQEGLDDFIYVFDSEPAGIGPARFDQLRDAVAQWRSYAPTSRLVALEGAGQTLTVIDDRPAWPSGEFVLESDFEARAYRLLAKGRTVTGLTKRLSEQGIEVSEATAVDLLTEWTRAGIVFCEDDAYVALATGLRW